jgi:hypothetical protein
VKAERYTESQVLYGLREAWEDMTGVDDPFYADTQIDMFMKADDTWDEIDFADIFRGLERFFDFTCSDKEWKDFFGFDIAKRNIDEWDQTVAPNLTFGALARFIADHAPMIASFDPITVFGHHCASAGVFTGIQRLADKLTDNNQRFAPSARIIDVMRGHDLDNFWTQLRWMTEYTIPPLPSFWRSVTCLTGFLGALATVGGLVAAWTTSNPVWIAPTLLGTIVLYLIALAYKRFTNPLPTDIVTFRDLSMLIARAQNTVTAN